MENGPLEPGQLKTMRAAASAVAGGLISRSREFFEKIGISPEAFQRLIADEDSDWTFIVKLHTVLEGSINQLLSSYFKDARLDPFFSRLELSDFKRGKLALVLAVDILPKPCCLFIREFSEIRNKLAHKIENLDFKIVEYVKNLTPQDRKNFIKILEGPYSSEPRMHFGGIIDMEPRSILLLTASSVLYSIETKHRELLFAAEKPESSPKES